MHTPRTPIAGTFRTARLARLGALLVAPLLAAGCGGGRQRSAESPVDDTAAVGLALSLGSGALLDTAMYTLTGPGGFSRSGTLDLAHSTTLSATIGGLPAAGPFTIIVTGMTTTGGITCMGTATFSVVARTTTQVIVAVHCQEAPRTGSATVDGTINVCPVLDELSASPAQVQVGASLLLTARAHDAEKQAITFHWAAAPSGRFSDAAAPTPTFTCTASGSVDITVTASDGDCGDSVSTRVTCSPAPVFTVAATVETDPVSHPGDAADDPAIWVNPVDPALSTIIGTDKTAGGGLGVYDLAGHELQFVTAGALNNVDLRDGFPLGGATVPLVTAGNRTDNSIAIFKIDPTTRLLTSVAARTITTLVTYGSCMYHSAVTGKFYYFVDSKAGEIEQWELFDNGAGLVDGVKVRNLRKLATQPEACVVDDELGFFYIGEEDVGIWKFAAEPTVDPSSPLAAGVLVDSTGPGGHLVADVEGLAIARTGAGTGYLIASNQGDSTYPIYTREGDNAYVKTFRIGSGPLCIDEVTGSDGIEVTTAALGPAFPSGVFVTQDDTNTPSGNQNFKLVPWQDILNGPAPADPVCQPGGGQGDGDGGASPAPDAGTAATDGGGGGAAGFPAEFCATFCGKCAGCWNPAAGFSEGDCLYQLVKPNFTIEDCLAGCAAGRTPGFPPVNLVAGWETLECLAFDESM